MSTPACTRNVEADAQTNFAGTKAMRETIGSDARAIAYAIAIIGVIVVVPFALLGQHFAPNVAKDLRHQSEMLSQAGDQAGAIAASRRAVDIYRGLMRTSAAQYAPKLAASLHELSIRLSEAGDDAGALAAIREAVEMRRRLAKYSPTYTPSLHRAAPHQAAIEAANLEQSLQLLKRIESALRGELPQLKTAENTAG
jgi:hypothetical protein